MRSEPPKIDRRQLSDLLEAVRAIVPYYTPEWSDGMQPEPGTALLQIFAHFTAHVIERLNQVPFQKMLAYLDMLGIKLLPAQSARAPLTFKLVEGSGLDILIPARTQAATERTADHVELPFETVQNLWATTSRLTEIISVDPFKDAIYRHTPQAIAKDGSLLEKQEPFTLFSGRNLQEHGLYLGHTDLFNIEGPGIIKVYPDSALRAGWANNDMIWEYWGENAAEQKDEWIALQIMPNEQGDSITTVKLGKTGQGKVKEAKLGEIFTKTGQPEIQDEAIRERKSRWIRCRLKEPLTENILNKLPKIQTIGVASSLRRPMEPDGMFTNDIPVNWQKINLSPRATETGYQMGVYPFGQQPRLYDTFYLGCQEAFSKKGATITVKFSLLLWEIQQSPKGLNPVLSWEFWDGKGWRALSLQSDGTDRFFKCLNTEGQSDNQASVKFLCPEDIETIEVNGQNNYWIRVRIIAGDYGRVEYISEGQEIMAIPRFKSPIITELAIEYVYPQQKELQYCLTYNNLELRAESTSVNRTSVGFQPFQPLPDQRLNLYLGFDRALKGGPIRIFFVARELAFIEATKPIWEWNYWQQTDWRLLDFQDETEGLLIPGHLELIGPDDGAAAQRLGRSLYWLQGSLKPGSYPSFPELAGIYPNTTWAIQAETNTNELLGSGNGLARQTLHLAKLPVLAGEEIRVREMLSEEEKQDLRVRWGENVIKEITDVAGKTNETWVRWSEAEDFADAAAGSRVYMLDRATGELRFGDGINGLIVPAGENNVKAISYQAGGGRQGNVKAGEIKNFKAAVPGVEKVTNPIAADGGADTASAYQMTDFGPALLCHRNRAVTVADFESLARLASRKIAKVKCLPNINNGTNGTAAGRVTVIIVPDAPGDKPFPSLQLRGQVRQYLEAHAAGTLSGTDRIVVVGPSYLEIGITIDVYLWTMDGVSLVEREIRDKLNAFFHPITGGPEGLGWEFGRAVSASDIYALLRPVKLVDHLRNLQFQYQGISTEDVVPVGPNFLVAAGTHRINPKLAKGGKDFGSANSRFG